MSKSHADGMLELLFKLDDKCEGRLLQRPDLVLHVTAQATICLERVNKRNREEKKGIDLIMLQALHEKHEEFVRDYPRDFARVVEVKTENVPVEDVAKKCVVTIEQLLYGR